MKHKVYLITSPSIILQHLSLQCTLPTMIYINVKGDFTDKSILNKLTANETTLHNIHFRMGSKYNYGTWVKSKFESLQQSIPMQERIKLLSIRV